MYKKLFWVWLTILLVINTIPLGDGANRVLKGTRFVFRLDCLVHSLTFLVFSGIYMLARLNGQHVFYTGSVLKYVAIVITAAVLFELIQVLLPYRAFNPWDLVSNLLGAVLGLGLILLVPEIKQPAQG